MKSFMVLLFLVSASVVHAIVVSDYNVAEQAPSGLDWRFVYNYKGSSAVAVDDYWILTAAHVADDAGTGVLSIGGTTYNQQEIRYHDSADLALVRYDKALPGSYDLYEGKLVPQRPIDPKYGVLMVGFGNVGSVSATYWTDSGSGKGTKRWGSQQIDRTAAVNYDAGGSVGTTSNNGFWMDFGLADTDHEAGVGVGDSGGGTFIDDNGTWKLAGINTIRSGSDGQYTSTFSVSMPDYSSWVTGVIPEPATASLVVLFGLGCLVAKRLFT